MLFKIAFVLAVVAPLFVAVPLLVSDLKLFRWIDEKLQHLAVVAVIVWMVAMVVGAVAWLQS